MPGRGKGRLIGRGRGGRAAVEKATELAKKIVLASTTTVFDLPFHLLFIIFENADIKTFWALTAANKIMHGLRKTPDLIALRHELALKEIPVHKALLQGRLSDAVAKRRIEERAEHVILMTYSAQREKCERMERDEKALTKEITVADAALSLVKSLEHMMTKHRAQKQEILDMKHKLKEAERSMGKMKIKEGQRVAQAESQPIANSSQASTRLSYQQALLSKVN